MRFGRTLRRSIYEPWKSYYIEYDKLKQLLREGDDSDNESSAKPPRSARNGQWTDEDEGAFVEELINVQLEKVYEFQVEKNRELRDRISACEAKLSQLVQSYATPKGTPKGTPKTEQPQPDSYALNRSPLEQRDELKAILAELDSITKEINELARFSRLNFTGFLKAAKKHDRKRGQRYHVRPLVQVRLGALPFSSEDYSPLLYRLSSMYSFVRQHLDSESRRQSGTHSESSTAETKYTSYKFWVHADNVMEVKTYILRRLPVLVYNPQTAKVADGADDPKITCLYLDNSKFSLYTQKVERTYNASSLRLRWTGQLSQRPEIWFEKKTVLDDDDSESIKFPIKEKYIQPFMKGEYKMEKSVHKLQDRQGQGSAAVDQYQKSVDEIQRFILDNELQPMLRANYTRTAFQIPGDNRVRISLDTDLALIREDSLDSEHPCREPGQWHREDIDNAEMEFPFEGLRKEEISRFPHALLEIKVREGARRKSYEWVLDLMESHLVKESARFSKFTHGVAVLFEDYINSFPFWLSELDQDIRRDPEQAFEEEQERKAKQAEADFAIGSYFGSIASPNLRPTMAPPRGRSPARRGMSRTQSMVMAKSSLVSEAKQAAAADNAERAEPKIDTRSPPRSVGTPTGLRSLLPSFSRSRYARAHHQSSVQLPPGIRHPGTLIKDSGPVRVEPKVWLANQRTFLRWQHTAILLSSLSLGLYNAAGVSNDVARNLAVVYTAVAVFAGAWGWWMYMVRSRLIRERSGKDFDNVVGPIIVCMALVVALCLNFAFQYRLVRDRRHSRYNDHGVAGEAFDGFDGGLELEL